MSENSPSKVAAADQPFSHFTPVQRAINGR
jgi:hypothetical protein